VDKGKLLWRASRGGAADDDGATPDPVTGVEPDLASGAKNGTREIAGLIHAVHAPCNMAGPRRPNG
jgi:hypothetical protein